MWKGVACWGGVGGHPELERRGDGGGALGELGSHCDLERKRDWGGSHGEVGWRGGWHGPPQSMLGGAGGHLMISAGRGTLFGIC